MLGRPLDLYPPNPRYLRFRGLPTLPITSAEHYGAVFNLDFDYHRYLGELTRCRFNYTRTASGTFVEREHTIEGSGWENSQAPRPSRFVGPWSRAELQGDEPGYAHGGPAFDLEIISAAYLDRLRDFVRQAGLRGVIVEFTLFTAMYSDDHWTMSPMHPGNNVQRCGPVDPRRVYTVTNDGLLDHQLAFVRLVITTLIEFDNVIIELINEPYFSGVESAWIDAVVDTALTEFDRAGRRLLLAWNYANVDGRITAMNPGLDVFTFHYCHPPTVVEQNHDLAVPVIYDESGYLGVDDTAYRVHAWDFLLAGGSGFNHLDYSYAPSGDEAGTRVLPGNASGGGGVRLREQLRVLVDFMAELPFAELNPVTMIASGPSGDRPIRGLAGPARGYAFSLHGDLAHTVTFDAEPGDYELTWVDPLTGFSAGGPYRIEERGRCRLEVPARRTEIAARLLPARPQGPRVSGDFDFLAAAHRG